MHFLEHVEVRGRISCCLFLPSLWFLGLNPGDQASKESADAFWAVTPVYQGYHIWLWFQASGSYMVYMAFAKFQSNIFVIIYIFSHSRSGKYYKRWDMSECMYFTHMDLLPAYTCLCTICMLVACGGQRKVSDALELESQRMGGLVWVLEIISGFTGRSGTTRSHWAIFPAIYLFIFKLILLYDYFNCMYVSVHMCLVAMGARRRH